MKKIHLLLTLFVFSAQAYSKDTMSLSQCDNHLLTVESDGQVSSGSYNKVQEAYRKGEFIRVGWELDFTKDGKVDVSHWVNVEFLSEFEGKVYAQIPAIQQQIPNKAEGNIFYPKHSQQWYGLLRTDGVLSGRYSHREGMSKEYRVRSMWCTF